MRVCDEVSSCLSSLTYFLLQLLSMLDHHVSTIDQSIYVYVYVYIYTYIYI